MTVTARQFGKVAVLMGGISAERDVSLRSGAAIVRALQDRGVDAHPVDANPDNIGSLLESGYDRAFNILHGRWGEDGVVQGALQAVGMPYTGSGVLGCALAMDKVRSKQVWQALGLPTARYAVVEDAAGLDGLIDQLGLPIFLKPAREGSSVGIAKVAHVEELESAFDLVRQHGDAVLAEEFIPGAELTVAILQGEALPVVRMKAANDFYDYEAKYHRDDTEYLCPAGLTDELETRVRELALQAFEALDCRGWGRVDIMLDAQRQPILLEVNPNPGMTNQSLVPMAAAASGVDFGDLVMRILETSL